MNNIPKKRIVLFFWCVVLLAVVFVIAHFSSSTVPVPTAETPSPSVDTSLTQYNDRLITSPAQPSTPVPSLSSTCTLSLAIVTIESTGKEKTYSIVAKNLGVAPCAGASLSLYYPDGEEAEGTTPAATSGGYYWSFGTLSHDQTRSIAVTTSRSPTTEGSLEGCLSAAQASDACAVADRTPMPSASSSPYTLPITLPPLTVSGTIPRIPGKEAGVWVWDFVETMDEPTMEGVVDAVSKNGGTALYLTVDNYLDLFYLPQGAVRSERIAHYERSLAIFLEHAHKKGIAVDAVAGWRDWGEPAKRTKAYDIMRLVAQFNSTHVETFRAMQFDIEPYLLPQYESDKATVLTNYVALVDSLQRLSVSLDLPLSLVIPHFYDAAQGWTPQINYQGNTAYTFNHLLALLNRSTGNSIIIMTYRNFAQGDNGTIELAQKEIVDADVVGGPTKIILAQETGDVTPAFVTFAGMSRAKLFEQLSMINEAFAEKSAYGGTAIHYLTPFLELR